MCGLIKSEIQIVSIGASSEQDECQDGFTIDSGVTKVEFYSDMAKCGGLTFNILQTAQLVDYSSISAIFEVGTVVVLAEDQEDAEDEIEQSDDMESEEEQELSDYVKDILNRQNKEEEEEEKIPIV